MDRDHGLDAEFTTRLEEEEEEDKLKEAKKKWDTVTVRIEDSGKPCSLGVWDVEMKTNLSAKTWHAEAESLSANMSSSERQGGNERHYSTSGFFDITFHARTSARDRVGGLEIKVQKPCMEIVSIRKMVTTAPGIRKPCFESVWDPITGVSTEKNFNQFTGEVIEDDEHSDYDTDSKVDTDNEQKPGQKRKASNPADGAPAPKKVAPNSVSKLNSASDPFGMTITVRKNAVRVAQSHEPWNGLQPIDRVYCDGCESRRATSAKKRNGGACHGYVACAVDSKMKNLRANGLNTGLRTEFRKMITLLEANTDTTRPASDEEAQKWTVQKERIVLIKTVLKEAGDDEE